MTTKKTGDAKYTFAFASDIQALADEKRIRVASFNVNRRKSNRGSYDYLVVSFIVPRPDRDQCADEVEAVATVEDPVESSEDFPEETMSFPATTNDNEVN